MSTKTLPLPDSSEPRLQAARMKAFEVQPAVPGTECPSEHFNRKGLPVAQGNQEEGCNGPGGWKLSWAAENIHHSRRNSEF